MEITITTLCVSKLKSNYRRYSVCVFPHQANGQADRIENVKPIFVEPKGKGNFTEV